VNLLLYSVYKNLGVDELKPIKVTILLIDRPVKILRGEVQDVLIKVSEFIFLVDLIILKIEPVRNPRGQILVILDRPFLITSNAGSSVVAV